MKPAQGAAARVVRTARRRSDADVAEISYTAFTSKPKAKQVNGRLIVRRVTDMNPNNQSELFTAYRYHAVFTDSPLPMLERTRPQGR